MKTIRWGIIGTGGIAATFATALNSVEGAELIAVSSRNISRAQVFADSFHIPKAYGTYEEMVKDSEIDVIYIGTPHTEHKSNAALCIQNGKAVLCEKPFTVNTSESEYLVALAKKHKVFLMEAMWTRFLPATERVKQWIEEKQIGQVKHIRASFGYAAEFNPESRLYSLDLAGGALLDVGVYPITYVVHMLDQLPDQIISSAIFGQTHVDEQNVIIMKYQEGVLAELSSSIALNTGFEAVIIGDKGRIVVPKFGFAEEAFLYDVKGELLEHFNEPFEVNGYVHEAYEVNTCLREGRLESEKLPLKRTLDIMRLMDGIRADWGLVYPQEKN